MAKFGEGDARWIVEERQDGTNVNAWHWTERDAVPWARDRLAQLLGGLQISNGEDSMWIWTTGVESVSGEAVVNTRKKKIIANYELEIKVGWEGEVRDGAGKPAGSAKGQLVLPYVGDENAGEDTEIRVSAAGEGPAMDRLRHAVVARGRPMVQKAVRQFVDELAAGGPLASGGGGGGAGGSRDDGTGAAAADSTSGRGASSAAQAALTEVKPERAPAAAESSKGTHSITLTERFYARPGDIWECFTHPGRIAAFTQSPAQVEPRPGGRFSLFGGSLTGEFVELDPPRRLVQRWRFSNWPEGATSLVEIELEEPETGTTLLKLKQTGIPAVDQYGNEDVLNNTKTGWQQQIFRRIRAVFGYGL